MNDFAQSVGGGRPLAVEVTVPASSANLGSGFDALGLALAHYDIVTVRVLDSGLRMAVTGQGAGSVPCDESHLVLRAFRAACDELGFQPPGLDISCRNSIPHGRGLGSSAAAVVAGVVAGYALAGREIDEQALRVAAGFEGHADNAAASLYGGLVIAWREADGFHSARLTPHPDLAPVLFVPENESVTATTRGLLPECVPHADAAFAVGRCALAVHALTVDPARLLAATDDRLHQHYRESAWPATSKLVAELRAAGVPAAVSGAGPSVLAFRPVGGMPDALTYSGFTRFDLDIDLLGARFRVVE
ncbi:MAG TPA: homoserine kinase [Pseudonocardiaceae bacterium]|jgi:homoserine kinase|nr:homoserine kinase [Pseudonocardiaceae bacterium]